MRKKNPISGKHAYSFVEIIKTIQEQLFNEKSPNSVENWGKKLKNLWNMIGKNPFNL